MVKVLAPVVISLLCFIQTVLVFFPHAAQGGVVSRSGGGQAGEVLASELVSALIRALGIDAPWYMRALQVTYADVC
jgi:hypothetical protein